MSNPDLLDQRIRVYELQNAGADGFERPVYAYLFTLWGRFDFYSDQQQVAVAPMQHTEYVEGIKASFSYRAAIPRNGILRRGEDIAFIRGIVKHRATWRLDVVCERVNVERFAEFQVYEGDAVIDGIHLVYPSSH